MYYKMMLYLKDEATRKRLKVYIVEHGTADKAIKEMLQLVENDKKPKFA